MSCERFRYNFKYNHVNDIKEIDQYFGNGMSLQTILIGSLFGVIIFNNLWLDEYESKDCLNSIITAEMVAEINAEICKAIAESVAIFEYNNRAYEEEKEDISYIKNAQNILNNWRSSMLAKIYSKEPILVKDLFVLQSNAYYTDEFVQHEYSTNNTLYLLKDIIAYIDKKYPHLNFKNMLTAVDEIQRII